jgi:hypothetical protein
MYERCLAIHSRCLGLRRSHVTFNPLNRGFFCTLLVYASGALAHSTLWPKGAALWDEGGIEINQLTVLGCLREARNVEQLESTVV